MFCIHEPIIEKSPAVQKARNVWSLKVPQTAKTEGRASMAAQSGGSEAGPVLDGGSELGMAAISQEVAVVSIDVTFPPGRRECRVAPPINFV
jgi:hypothetical protein